MQYVPIIFPALVLLIGITIGANSDPAQPYCFNNKTEISHKVVTKTRLKTVNKKGFFNKLAQKKETQVEVYETSEPVYKIKVERVCCEGYKLTELDMCEPQCIENGCPVHSKCVEPEVCECIGGYFSARSPQNDKHYCEPICKNPCPEHSVCVAPNECACKKGFKVTDSMKCEPYCASGCQHGVCVAPNKCECQKDFKAMQGSCVPICSLGDQCQNGKCVDKDQCVCNYGFEWNSEMHKCEMSSAAIDLYGIKPSTIYPTTIETQENSDMALEVETDIETFKDDIDPSQVFDENIVYTTFDTSGYENEDFSTPRPEVKQEKCADGYVYHKGQCRPLKFASSEIDCHFKPCQDKHALCLENGTCACAEGYEWFRTHVLNHDSMTHTIKAMCLTIAEYEARLQNLGEEPEKIEISEISSNWVTIFFTVLGVLILILALVFLILKLVRTQRGEIDVEGKNLACSYNSRDCGETEKSVI